MPKRTCWCCQVDKEKLVEICRDCTGGTVIDRYKKLLKLVQSIARCETFSIGVAFHMKDDAVHLLKEIGETE